MRSRRRVLVVVAGVAVASLAVGAAVGTRLMSPADAVAKTAPPKASKITVPVEKRLLQSTVVSRADASSSGATNVELQPQGAAIVTGKVPKAGQKLTEGQALLEITGRPILALAGVLPMWRSLSPGTKGPDVKQLEQALDRLGFDPGTVDDTYTTATSNAVADLFDEAGYDAPLADERLRQALQQAKDEVKSAQSAVKDAKKAFNQALSARAKHPDPQTKAAVEQTAAAYRQAKKRSNDSYDKRDKAQTAAGTPLPQGEVYYLTGLPRKVDSVAVKRGSAVKGKVMTLSGTGLVITASVTTEVKQLLRKGMKAKLDLGSGSLLDGTIQKIAQGDGGKWNVTLQPGKLSSAQYERLKDSNIRITIPIGATRGKVLSVPLAALSAGSGGESRVEVLRGKQSTLVEVTVGLTAEGYAEVTPTKGTLRAGDLVVVGR